MVRTGKAPEEVTFMVTENNFRDLVPYPQGTEPGGWGWEHGGNQADTVLGNSAS